MAAAKTPRELEIHEIQQLRAPFTADAIRFKVQAGGGTQQQPSKALMVAYIDARLVIERLNYVVGYDWSATFTPIDGGLECALTVRGSTRHDVGEPGDSAQGKKPKALRSDALKRAGVQFGIGVSVYALPKMRLDPSDLYYAPSTGKLAGLKASGEKKLRDGYTAWLKNTGTKAFGDPIDHGDAPEAIGDHDVNTYVEPDTGEVVSAPTATTVTAPKPTVAEGRAAVADSAAGRSLTPKPAHEQQEASQTGSPVPDAAPQQTMDEEMAAENAERGTDPAPPSAEPVSNFMEKLAAAQGKKNDEGEYVSTQDARSPSEMAADAMCGPDGWMPRGASQAAKEEREMIAQALAFLSDKTAAELPKTWPARGVMAYGLLGDAVQNHDEFLAALADACNAKVAAQ
jgi:hypothetical protein